MTDKATVFEAMNAVMKDVRAVEKGERNSAPNGNYNFRGIDAVTNAVGPALREHGVIVAPKVMDWQYGTVTVGRNQTQMGHARLLIEFTWYGPQGDSITTIAAGEAFDSGDKATAKAHSVAFRTAMLQTLCLPTDDRDPDQDKYERSGAEQGMTEADQAREQLLSTLMELGIEPGEAAEKFAHDNNDADIRTSTNTKALQALTTHYRDLRGE